MPTTLILQETDIDPVRMHFFLLVYEGQCLRVYEANPSPRAEQRYRQRMHEIYPALLANTYDNYQEVFLSTCQKLEIKSARSYVRDFLRGYYAPILRQRPDGAPFCASSQADVQAYPVYDPRKDPHHPWHHAETRPDLVPRLRRTEPEDEWPGRALWENRYDRPAPV